MWGLFEAREASKVLDRLPPQVAEKYAFWCALGWQSGPQGLRAIKSFHGEKLAGQLAHVRSLRLDLQWRVLYRVEANIVTVCVERVSPHNDCPQKGSKPLVTASSKKSVAHYAPAKIRVSLTAGDLVRIARELQELTQAELATRCGMLQPTISAIETGRVTLGAERAEKLARTRCAPRRAVVAQLGRGVREQACG